MSFKPILYVVGILLCILAFSMVFPMLIDVYFHNADWQVFLVCMMATFFFGGLLILTNKTEQMVIRLREGFLLTTCSWMALSLFGALPLWLSALDLSFTDAVFESVSGITTTGATVLSGLEDVAPGLLLWRAILQWLGGVGIIVMALSLLPFLGVGGMQLFRTESSEHEKAMPRARELATSIFYIYCGLTVLCLVGYILSGFSLFDALVHAMTTLSTGGFSTSDTSFMNVEGYGKDMVAIIFMICGALPFTLYVKFVRGNKTALHKDPQVRGFLGILFFAIFILSIWELLSAPQVFNLDLFMAITFNVTSLLSGTGFANADYGLWDPFAIALFFFLMAVGGCAGSASCGLKIFRFQILYAVTLSQFRKLLSPNAVFTSLYNKKPISSEVSLSVMGFFFLFAVCFTALASLLSLTGLDYLTSMSGAISALSNVGPGLGMIIGPAGNYAALSDAAKWILSFGMILGRLELFTVLVLFLPRFWKP